VRGGDACDGAAFQIDRRGARPLPYPPLFFSAGDDGVGAEHQMRCRAAEDARQISVRRVAAVAGEYRGWHYKRAWPERRVQPAGKSEADQPDAALFDERVCRRFRARRRPTADRNRPANTPRDARFGRQPDDDTNAHG
jgi:hypothetical protein